MVRPESWYENEVPGTVGWPQVAEQENRTFLGSSVFGCLFVRKTLDRLGAVNTAGVGK